MKPYLKLLLIVTGSFLAAYLVLKFIAPLFAPFILAFLLSIAMEPLVNLMQEKLKLSRGRSVLLSMAIFILIIASLLGFLVRRLIIELINLSAALPEISRNLWPMIQQWQKSSYSYFLPITRSYPKIYEAIQANINSVVSKLQDITSSLLNTLLSTITGVTGLFIIIVFAVIATYFLSRDRRLIMRFWIGILPEPWGKKSIQVIKDILQALAGYVKAQLFLITMTMILTTIGLYIIGAKYALTMGIIIGFCDLLPVLGPGTIYVPWVIFSFVQRETTFGIALAILYVIILVIRQIVETKVVSENMGLHPLATLIAIYVGLQVFGVMGVVIGPLAVITVKAIARAANITIIK